ncbi:MAG: TIM barrel protein [Chloroflexi bacterium]|nr:TIM barrel protein [Chloroflexota bacterium]
MKNTVELMNLFWTSAGIYPVTADISRFDFRDRVEAAAKAGFKGIGLWHTDLEHILYSRTLPEMKLILDDNGIIYLELEFLTDWFLEGGRKAESDNRKRRLFEASAALNAKHVKIGDFYNSPYSMPRLVESFAALCKEAEDYGATIGFEFMASAMLNTLKDSLTMVEQSGATNGGLILDIVHVVNLGITYEEINRIPVQYLINVELNDGTLPGSPRRDPSRERRYCGEGEFDIKGFIRCIDNMGYSGPWAVEVFSPELTGLSLEESNTRAFNTTIAQFD